MKDLKMPKNIIYLRKKRGITQEALAEFLGVTKASVSKWETGQSLPDILLLPKIASYFDISIDELMGYQAQLTTEEIRRHYYRFSADFGKKELQTVMKETRDFVKEYYSCYPALLQIAVLWLNHHMLSNGKEEQKKILEETVDLCRHIEDQCANMRICQNASACRAMACLFMGDAKEVIRILEPQHDPNQLLGQTEGILIQAYQLSGESQKAESFNQYMIYTHLLALTNDSIAYLAGNMNRMEVADKTIERIEQVMQTYQIQKLHPNTALLFYLQKAMTYCLHDRQEEALAALKKYLEIGEPFIRRGCSLHGDDYFDRIDDLFKDYDLGAQAPRSRQTIWDSFWQVLDHPAFSVLQENSEFQQMKKKLQDRKKGML